MKTDLLKIYAKSNLSSFYTYIVTVFAFVYVRIRLYGLPPAGTRAFYTEVGGFALILFFSYLALMQVRDIYRAALSETMPLRERDCTGMTIQIALLKLVYMTLWLYFLFMPLSSPGLFEHYVGFAFVFFALGIYASVSAAYLPLFLWDIAIQLGFAARVLWLHRDMETTPYLAGIFLMFAFYTFVSGLRITKTTKQLVESSYALKKAANVANRANKSKSDFLAVMSHEIRTPMTGILGMVDFLSETKLEPEQKSCVEAITECSRTLLNTLNDILDLSKIEAGKLTISNTNFDLHGLLDNAVKVLNIAAAEKNVELRLKIGSEAPKHIYGDPHRIRQSVMNLINNAIKFTEAGYVEVSVSLREGMIRIAVEDTGIGIKPDRAKYLFKPFSQADNTISRKYGGSGLGLSITKYLVEAMGGKIDMHSTPGIGSTFWIDVPYKPPVPESAESVKDKKTATTPAQNILVVEDNRINQMICSRLLEQKGHHVTVTGDGVGAMELIGKNKYDLVLMDCSLPGKSGMDITREIRALGGRNKQLPIIALTANGMEENLKQCLEAGMNDCIVKPYEPQRLYSVIASYAAKAPAAAPPPPAEENNKLKSLQDEMGPEYTEKLIRSSFDEISRLVRQIVEGYAKKYYDGVQKSAHDLKAVSGSIGMQQTQRLAEAIEKACIHKHYGSLSGVIGHLGDDVKAEMGAFRK